MTIDHDDIEPRVRLNRACKEPGPCPDLEAAYLDLHDEVQRLRAELAQANNEFGSETAEWPALWRRIAELKDISNDRWQRAEKAEAERDALRAALSPFAKAGELFSGDPGTVEFDQCIYSPAAGSEYALCGDDLRRARQALKGQTNE